MKTDIEIAQSAEIKPIDQIAKSAGIPEEYLEHYGKYMAKIDLKALNENKKGKLILMTAITPTPAGEGKTTTSIGLADALRKVGKNAGVALREPSLGPVFGIKGGAAGGGYAQVIPMEHLNLHFTGDFHAIGAANNLLAAMLDNHIHQGNALNIDPRRIAWRRCVDMNDRQLRNVLDGLGKRADGFPRQDGFDITVASEVMAAFCLATSLKDLKERLGRMIVAYDMDRKPITAHDLKAEGAMTVLLKDALQPNLVQTLEGTPAFVHGGPFANIAHGCNSVLATKMGLSHFDYLVTEAGFGADLGAEKFMDIKCRAAGIEPDAVVIVATIRALKMHGGLDKKDLGHEDLEALKKGMPNLLRHVENITKVFNRKAVVALNEFPTDTEAEVELVKKLCAELDVEVSLSQVWAKGGEGGIDLANKVIALAEEGEKKEMHYVYDMEDDLKTKITKIATKIYRAKSVSFSKLASGALKRAEEDGFKNAPICVAKTQYSFSDDPTLLGAPEDFVLHVEDARVSAGAGFVVLYTGDIMTMPGLPKEPAAEKMDVLDDGRIVGLF